MSKRIILVHGLGGTKDATWGRFPEFLNSDESIDYDITSYGYESPPLWPLLWNIFKRAPSIPNIANGLLTEIKNRCDLENDEIILVGHSLGGIIVKSLLLQLKIANTNHNIKKVCFFDVPHDGSGYANVIKYIFPRNRHLKSICRDSSELDLLNDQWISSGLIDSVEILSVVCANDSIVSSSSSKSIYRNHQVETINNADHRSIVKPQAIDDIVYVVLKNFIQKKTTVLSLKSFASRDLIDWERVDRPHNLTFVTDKKREEDLNSIIKALANETTSIRVTAASGLGKTRTLLEAIKKSKFSSQDILVFNAASHDRETRDAIRRAVRLKLPGLIIVEECTIDFHNELVNEIKNTECKLSIITLGFFHDYVQATAHIKLSPLDNDAIRLLLKYVLVSTSDQEVEKFAKFFQGYPLMVTLLAELYQNGQQFTGYIDDSSIVNRLISGGGQIEEYEKKILQACSLFDVFGVDTGEPRRQAKFIAENVAKSSLEEFDQVISRFTKRQIINRAGRFARIVPKPLSVTLAAKWWEESNYDRQVSLLMDMPASLISSFSIQLQGLDAQGNVQNFSEKLCVHSGPFGKAEVLFTEKGSRFFRALVELNPKTTSNLLHRLLNEMSQKDILAINGEVRRNLVWALERLCFHSAEFDKAASSLLTLAVAENETWSNNATGIFVQLFRVSMSGTAALPTQRFDVLREAIAKNELAIDLIVIKALEQAIDTFGGIRILGAEYQGTKPPLEEWTPKLWQEIFDYWDTAFVLFFILFERKSEQREKVVSIIGHAIRGLFNQGRIELLDNAIHKVVKEHGRYWPEGLDSLKKIEEYDLGGTNDSMKNALASWLNLLKPDDSNLSEQIKILVTNPPWEHREDSNGHYIDVGDENAKNFADSVAQNVESIFPYLTLLLNGEQKKSYIFGMRLALSCKDVLSLYNATLEQLREIEHPNIVFFLGVLEGLYKTSKSDWESKLNDLVNDHDFVRFYPDFIRTGEISEKELNLLIRLIDESKIEEFRVANLANGSVLNLINSEVIANFCINLASKNKSYAWVALDIMYMYLFANKECIPQVIDALITLVTNVSLNKDDANHRNDIHHWKDLSEKLLPLTDAEFARSLITQLIHGCKLGFNHADLWHAIKPVLASIMQMHGHIAWPMFAAAIEQAEGLDLYWLQQLLIRENGISHFQPSMFKFLDHHLIIQWCRKNPKQGPLFVARCIEFFSNQNGAIQLNQLLIELLENFGNDKYLKSELSANFFSRGWSGSLVPHLELDRSALSPLLQHSSPSVRQWAKEILIEIDERITFESARDEERNFDIY